MKGLTSYQAARLLKQYGLNEIIEQKKAPLWKKFFEQFNNFLTILLILAAGFSFFIGEVIDGALILTIVILNAFFGLYQEIKAEESIAALKKMTVSRVRVIRDGREQEIDSRYLVPGDVIFVEEGTKIPADGVVVEGRNLEVNEAALTGESIPVTKSQIINSKFQTNPNIQNSNQVFSGTIVTKGRGYMKVTATGMNTKFGKIAQNLSIIEDTKTPLQKKLIVLTRFIGLVGILAAVIVFLISYWEGVAYFPAFLLAISLAVAVVPEGLPAVMTITLAIGVKKMAQKKAIVRKLSAIEALGSITLIATDKTGTLTTNKMKVKEIYINNKIFNEKFKIQNSKCDALSLLLLNSILCSTASLVYDAKGRPEDVLGDPTEGALLYLAHDRGLDIQTIRNEWKVIDEKPFDSVTKMMTVIVQKNPKSEIRNPKIEFVKGAPESILAMSDKILVGNKEQQMDDRQKEQIEKQVEQWASQGLRVLAFGYSKAFSGDGHEAGIEKGLRNSSPPHDTSFITDKPFTFLGLVAIHDAPRPEVTEAVRKAKEAGIKIVMITGDNEKTAEAIGVLAGIIKNGNEILNGDEIEKYSDKELMQVLPKVRVFARTNPFQKYRIVKLYQESGEIVAVTGDGVNDAIALKQADVGVAMGLVGTDVAREVADMVITDDNFASIVNAVEEGRNIIKNLKNAIKYLLSCNMTEAISLIVGLMLGLPTLFYAIQLLYINLVTDGFPALSLAFSPKNPKIMKESPEKEMSLLSSLDNKFIVVVGILGSILVLGSYFLLGKAAAFSVLVLIQSFILVDLWLSHQAIKNNYQKLVQPIFLTAFIFPFIIQYVIVSVPSAANLFRITPLTISQYLVTAVISSLILVGIKAVKVFLRLEKLIQFKDNG